MDKTKWWMTCPLDDFRLRPTLAAIPADMEAWTREQHGANCHVEQAREYATKEKKGRGLPPPFIINANASEDTHKFQVPWLTKPHGVPPAICQDHQTCILDSIDTDICMWLKAMAPKGAKHYHRFRNLIYKVTVLLKGEESPLLWQSLTPPLADTLCGSVQYQFSCPLGKEMNEVTADDILLYLRSHIGLTQTWVREWVIPFMKCAHESKTYNLAARHAKDAREEKDSQKKRTTDHAEVVKGCYDARLTPIQPPSVLVALIAEARAATPLAGHIREPSAPTSSLVIQTDNPPPRAASPLPYSKPSALVGDVPMVESMEALYITYVRIMGQRVDNLEPLGQIYLSFI
jgi:hypothetical protein